MPTITIKTTDLGTVTTAKLPDGRNFNTYPRLSTGSTSKVLCSSQANPYSTVTLEGFIGIDLSELPAGATISGGTLTVEVGSSTMRRSPAGTQTPDANHVRVDLVDIGGALDSGDISETKPGVTVGLSARWPAGGLKLISIPLNPLGTLSARSYALRLSSAVQRANEHWSAAIINGSARLELQYEIPDAEITAEDSKIAELREVLSSIGIDAGTIDLILTLVAAAR